jgi:tetratricopeptide (TPR) repeat protein
VTSSSAPSTNDQQQLAAAHAALTQGKLDTALTLVETLLQRLPTWAPAVHLAGLIAKAVGDLSRAEDLMRRSLELPGTAPRARAEYANNLGNLLRGAGYPASAAAAYELAIELAALPQAAIGLARALLELERPEEALQIIATHTGASTPLLAVLIRSEALAQLGERQAALNALGAVSEVEKTRSSFWVALGSRLAALGRFEEAETALMPLLSTPDAAAAILALGELRVMSRDWVNALEILRKGIQQFPHSIELHSRYAGLAWMMGDHRHFADPMRKALAERPTNSGLRLALVTALGNAGFHDEAEQILRAGQLLRPNDPHFLSLLSLRCAETDRLDEAAQWIETAFSIAPEFELVREHAAIVALCQQQPDVALTHTEWLTSRRPLGQFAWALHTTALRTAARNEWRRVADPDAVCHTRILTPPAGYVSIEAFNAKLADRLRARHNLAAHPLVNSVRQGTQVEILPEAEADPIIREFFEMIRAPIASVIASMPEDSTHPLHSRKAEDFQFSGCWTVRLRGGSGKHVSHIHPRGWLSSAYYVEVPETIAPDPNRGGWLRFGDPPYPIKDLAPSGWVQPKSGTLALFPSYQWHGVEPFAGKSERITIAFDIVPRKSGR